MAYNLMDYVRAFHTYSKKRELSASARSLMSALFGEFNEARWPRELCFSDGELATLSGVRKRETIRDAKNLLKEFKWINFRAGKNRKSVYELLTDNLTSCHLFGQPTGQLANQVDNLPDNLPDNLGGNLPDNLGGNLGGFPIERTRVDCRQEDSKNHSLNRASVCDDVDELIDCWEAAGGTKLNQLILSKFAVLLKTHTLAEMKSAIERAGLDKNGSYDFAYNFFLSKLNEKKPVKGGNTNGNDFKDDRDPRDHWKYSG